MATKIRVRRGTISNTVVGVTCVLALLGTTIAALAQSRSHDRASRSYSSSRGDSHSARSPVSQRETAPTRSYGQSYNSSVRQSPSANTRYSTAPSYTHRSESYAPRAASSVPSTQQPLVRQPSVQQPLVRQPATVRNWQPQPAAGQPFSSGRMTTNAPGMHTQTIQTTSPPNAPIGASRTNSLGNATPISPAGSMVAPRRMTTNATGMHPQTTSPPNAPIGASRTNSLGTTVPISPAGSMVGPKSFDRQMPSTWQGMRASSGGDRAQTEIQAASPANPGGQRPTITDVRRRLNDQSPVSRDATPSAISGTSDHAKMIVRPQSDHPAATRGPTTGSNNGNVISGRSNSTERGPSLSEIRRRIVDQSGPPQRKDGSTTTPTTSTTERRDGAPGHLSGKAVGNPPAAENLRRTLPGNHGRDAAGRSHDGPGAGQSHPRSDDIAGRAGVPKARFSDRLHDGQLETVTKGKVAEKVRLADQYKAYDKGDVARRLDLHKQANHAAVANHGGDWNRGHGHPGPGGPHRNIHHHPNYFYFGFINPRYYDSCIEFSYFGPSWYASSCWYPRWTPWVHWSWYYHPHAFWDPRPIWCRPVVYTVAPVWVYYETPVWRPLPIVTSGTWVDVDRVVIEPDRYDLQLLAVRFVDPGHPEEKLGPRYRVWFRNNSTKPISQAFNVTLVASDEGRLRAGLPQAGVRVAAVEAGGVQSVDVRLPFEVYQMKLDAAGKPVPFSTLHVLVDADREIAETSRENNGARLAPADVLPVDPAAFEADPTKADAGGEILVAGEGLGPEPGKVLLNMGGIEMEAEILGWYDLGIRLRLPSLPLADETNAELVVLRGDGAAANPLPIIVRPPARGPELVNPPGGNP